MKKGNIAIACPGGMRIVTGYIDPVHQIGYAHPEGGRGWAAVDLRTGYHIGGGDTRKAAEAYALPRITAARESPVYQAIPDIRDK